MEDQKPELQHVDKASPPLTTVAALNGAENAEDELVLRGKYGTTAIDDNDFKLVRNPSAVRFKRIAERDSADFQNLHYSRKRQSTFSRYYPRNCGSVAVLSD